ncbi:MAG: hypothetical protein NZM04_00180 [Methylacidiphilales bacterium]|nr:hypothetical protein [Candidatus Methylacidiphilales bacterium]
MIKISQSIFIIAALIAALIPQTSNGQQPFNNIGGMVCFEPSINTEHYCIDIKDHENEYEHEYEYEHHLKLSNSLIPNPYVINIYPRRTFVPMKQGDSIIQMWLIHNNSSVDATVQISISANLNPEWEIQTISGNVINLSPSEAKPYSVRIKRHGATLTNRLYITLRASVIESNGNVRRVAHGEYGSYRLIIPFVRRNLISTQGDIYEPDNNCSQYKDIGIGQTQQRSFYTGSSNPDTDIIRMQIPGSPITKTYILRFRGTAPSTDPSLRIYYTGGICGVGAYETFTSTNGLTKNVGIIIPQGSSMVNFTLWISSTNAIGINGPNHTYTVTLSPPSTMFSVDEYTIDNLSNQHVDYWIRLDEYHAGGN